MSSRPTFAIRLSRLSAIDASPGMISLVIDDAGGSEGPRRIGNLTDAALRGRLSHFDAHSANEIAAIRQALSTESGSTTIYETWARFDACCRFWHEFTGSQVRLIEWACDGCAQASRDYVGGTVGESFLRRCKCGKINRVTVSKPDFPK